ncbi:LuxR C-terminal-related transcriptional regulator [Klebsiella aerogenes]|uniref:LuxR C-terminal-related transcriptional regulator n=1 Tax=Klebsiella aerogenes TaxID=548 RepID=UPI001D0DDB66
MSNRELECLRLAALGQTVDESGQTLGISGRTVEFHTCATPWKSWARRPSFVLSCLHSARAPQSRSNGRTGRDPARA